MEHARPHSPPVIAAALTVPRVDARTELAAGALALARSTALGVLGDPAAAEDVAQEVAIARALGCRPATVRSLLSRGREALRETLEET